MKELALQHGVAIFQPENVNTPQALEQLRQYQADLFVVAAYGQILSAELLRIPRLGAINLHASLLPKFRGAAPIQYAVLRGETVTGVTIFQIEPRLDAGPILGMVPTAIGPRETAGHLEERLALLGAPLVVQVIEQIETGTTSPWLQDKSQVSKAPKMTKRMGEIDWSRPSCEIDCHIRAMQPWPMPSTYLRTPGRPELRVLILAVEPVAGSRLSAADRDRPAGAVLPSGDSALRVRTGDGVVDVVTLQPVSKRAMSAREFLRGYPLNDQSTLGPATQNSES